VWLLEEFERAGVQVVFLERPPTGDPQDVLFIQIRGAVADYERTVIADRMRRGRLSALRCFLWPLKACACRSLSSC